MELNCLKKVQKNFVFENFKAREEDAEEEAQEAIILEEKTKTLQQEQSEMHENQKQQQNNDESNLNVLKSLLLSQSTIIDQNRSNSSTSCCCSSSNINSKSMNLSKTTTTTTNLRKSQSIPIFKHIDANELSSNNNNNNNDGKYELYFYKDKNNKITKNLVKTIQQQQQYNVDPKLKYGCAHYKRRAMFVTPCCNKFYKCRFCHDAKESHHFDRKTLTELICSECNMRQKVQEKCEHCGTRFGKYTCLICNLFDDTDKQQYHCHGCGICRIGGAENFFHCLVCNMCLPIHLKIDGHRCVENISRSHCPVCLGDIHTSRIPCHIPDCGHLLHKMCFDQLLTSGHYTCPTCQTSMIDMTALWEFLDVQAQLTPLSKELATQSVTIFCNDCHKTSVTNFHYIGLKCCNCGAYNTTQDVKRRVSSARDEPNSA